MNNIKYAAQVIVISNVNCITCLLDNVSAVYVWKLQNVWSCSVQSCSDRFMTLCESFERIRAITQGEWKFPVNDICSVLFYYAVQKIYSVTSPVKLRELFIQTSNDITTLS